MPDREWKQGDRVRTRKGNVAHIVHGIDMYGLLPEAVVYSYCGSQLYATLWKPAKDALRTCRRCEAKVTP